MSPRSGSEKRQRTTIVTMRISPQEAATIRQLAQNRGETVSAMMRSALLHNRPRLTRIDLQAVARLLGQLGKIGSNINQIAHRYNMAEGRPSGNIEGALETALNELLEWRMALMQALGYERNRKEPKQ